MKNIREGITNNLSILYEIGVYDSKIERCNKKLVLDNTILLNNIVNNPDYFNLEELKLYFDSIKSIKHKLDDYYLLEELIEKKIIASNPKYKYVKYFDEINKLDYLTNEEKEILDKHLKNFKLGTYVNLQSISLNKMSDRILKDLSNLNLLEQIKIFVCPECLSKIIFPEYIQERIKCGLQESEVIQLLIEGNHNYCVNCDIELDEDTLAFGLESNQYIYKLLKNSDTTFEEIKKIDKNRN